jgi:DNA-binding PucR family transcriptional regulator
MNSFVTRLSDLLSTLCRDLGQRDDTRVLASVGGYRAKLLLANQSYQEARQAMMILENKNNSIENSFVFWEQLGGARLIATLADTEPAREFCKQMLAPLLQKDHKNEEFIRTLLCFDENGSNLRITAEKLSLHYNSLKYRTTRIWELLGIDPTNSEHRFNLSLALRIYKVLKGNL